MIWNEELSASFDQAAGVIVFHRIELSRTQQLSQVLADKVSALVDQNEKSLDIKLGGSSGWGDRAEGAKGDKREQVQERRGGRRGGSARGMSFKSTSEILLIHLSRPWRTWWAICSRSGQPNAWPGYSTMMY